eukprot:TRINITY_DN7316_c0_g1_i1.p2 TRINITY_DN7316_c0_g1~~TRINITY_DN7316_c0_g1_i1.p2  ORF type:complete len:507 (-),score=148.24 TRINITY_DN7316_c0_g1_i1:182-1702(-)
MSRRLATMGRTLNEFNVDRLDSCNEVTLGLCSTFCVTFGILAIMFPLFNLAIFELNAPVGNSSSTLSTTAYVVPLTTAAPAYVAPPTRASTTSSVTERTYAPTTQEPTTARPSDRNRHAEKPATGEASPELQQYRKGMQSWTGSSLQSCRKLDLSEDGKIPLSEFQEACHRAALSQNSPFSALSKDDGDNGCGASAEKLFKEIDDDGDGDISGAECSLGLDSLQYQLKNLGDATATFKKLDVERTGLLTRAQFAKLGESLHPALKPSLMDKLFVEMDANENNFVDKAEFLREAQCGDPESCEGHAIVEELSNADTGKFAGVPAVLEGRAQISISVPELTEVPEDLSESADKCAKVLKEAFKKYTGLDVNVQEADIHHRSALARFRAIQSGETPHQVRYANLYWDADASDGGKFLLDMKKDAGKVQEYVQSKLKEALPWLKEARVQLWGRHNAKFYGKEAVNLPNDNAYQHFGLTPDEATERKRHYRCDISKGPCQEDTQPFVVKDL